jgi:hypothetical protein
MTDEDVSPGGEGDSENQDMAVREAISWPSMLSVIGEE